MLHGIILQQKFIRVLLEIICLVNWSTCWDGTFLKIDVVSHWSNESAQLPMRSLALFIDFREPDNFSWIKLSIYIVT